MCIARFHAVGPIITARCTSAKRSIAIACRPSVRPSVCLTVSVRFSVTLVDQEQIRCNSWKLIARTLLARHPKAIHLIPGERREIWWRIEVKKVACWSTKAAIGLSLKRVKIEEKLHEPIGTHRRSFERYHPDPLRPPVLKRRP